MSNHHRKRTHKPSLLAKLLAMLPVGCALFYPVYLAAQLYTDTQTYVSPSLPAAFDGLKITFLSDIHYGQLFSRERVEKLVKRVNALGSDLILLGGDYGEDSQGALDFWNLQPGFSAPLGVFATVGNHDRTIPDHMLYQIEDAMRSQGVIPLVNDVWTLNKGDASLAIGSVDDFYNGFPDLAAVAHKSKDADFVIFMPHTPDILPEWTAPAFYDLALCGHTHGGQVAIRNHAIFSSSIYGSRYLNGWYKENGADIFVSSGVGTSALPVRLGTKAQIHQFTLFSAAPNS